MVKRLYCGVDFGHRLVRAVVCTPLGLVLRSGAWPIAELGGRLPEWLRGIREASQIPVVVRGRLKAPWPSGLMDALLADGIDVDLVGGRTPDYLLALERSCREDPTYLAARFLAIIGEARGLTTLEQVERFVFRWYARLGDLHYWRLEAEAERNLWPALEGEDYRTGWDRCAWSLAEAVGS